MIEWSLTQKKVVATHELHKPIWRAAYSSHTSASYLIYTKENNRQIAVVKPGKKGLFEELTPIPLPEIKGTCKQMQISQSGKVLACLIGRTLVFTRLDRKSPVQTATHEVPMISLAISPRDDTLLTGDLAGKLTYWHLSADSAAPTQSTYHWHAHAIESVAFSADASLVYSGGQEGVLVIWHNNTNSRTFLPRLAGRLDVLACSADGTMLAVGLSNNSLRVIK